MTELDDKLAMQLTEPSKATASKQALILAAREWVAECADCGIYRDVDAEYVMTEATDAEIVANVRSQYDGGWAGFVRDYSGNL